MSARECVWRIVKHDVKELGGTLHGESVRFVGTLHQIAVDETRRVWRQIEALQQSAVDETARLRGETARLRGDSIEPVAQPHARPAGERPVRRDGRVQPAASASSSPDSSDDGLSGTLARLSVALFAQQASVIESYVHWRWPLLSWWVLNEATGARSPVAFLLARLLASTDTESGIATVAAAGLKGGRAAADSEAPLALNLHEALMHMRPQIVAKIRHTVFHDPLSACTFAAVALRLLLILPLVQIGRLLGERTRPFRQTLQRLALREAMRASERCNRVELRTSLPPPTRPRHGAHAFGTPLWSPRALRWIRSNDGR